MKIIVLKFLLSWQKISLRFLQDFSEFFVNFSKVSLGTKFSFCTTVLRMAKRGGPGSIQRLLKAESEANANIATARQSMY